MGEDQELKERAGRHSQSGKANALMVAISLGFLLVAFSYPKFAARGQNYGASGPGHIFMPPNIVTPPIVVPTDVTNPHLTNPGTTAAHNIIVTPNYGMAALAGIQKINDFPKMENSGRNSDWITILAKEGASFSKPNNFTADLKNGDIIVSVKTPSRLAFVITPYGDIAVGANSDVMISYNGGVLRVMNFDGEGRVLKIKLDKGPFGGPADPTVTVAPGYELVASDKTISRSELRPRDGIARRGFKTLENGHLAISEFSLESAAHAVGMLVNIQQTTTGIKERRIITDLSKMAAVLNQRSGEQGYTVEK